MIRQDYILRMIEQLRRVLASIAALKEERRWQEITGTLDEQFTELVGAGAAEAVRFSDTELMARLVQGENTQFVRDKTHFLIALFKEAGDAAAAQDQAEESRAFYVKGLHLLLGTASGGDSFEAPGFVPGLEVLLAGVGGCAATGADAGDAHAPLRTARGLREGRGCAFRFTGRRAGQLRRAEFWDRVLRAPAWSERYGSCRREPSAPGTGSWIGRTSPTPGQFSVKSRCLGSCPLRLVPSWLACLRSARQRDQPFDGVAFDRGSGQREIGGNFRHEEGLGVVGEVVLDAVVAPGSASKPTCV